MAVIYAFIIKTRNKFFDKNIFKTKKVNSKIISIGNITVGGSGKTPAVVHIVEILKKSGIKVGILSRGYGRKSKGYLLVSDGENLKTSVAKSGDEMYLLASECEVPAAVSEKRVDGAKKFLKDAELDAIVLDDAFQHRWIYRDTNILIFDQRFLNKTGSLEQSLLPIGVMREPFSACERADAIIINRKFSKKTDIPFHIKKYLGGKPRFEAFYKAAGIYDVKTHKFYSIEEFKGQKSLVVCGIAQPFSFLHILEQNNINIDNKILFTDHRNYTNKDIQQIRKKFYDSNSFSVLTTQKDAVKLTNYSRELDDIDIYYLKIEMHIENEEEFEKFILKFLNN